MSNSQHNGSRLKRGLVALALAACASGTGRGADAAAGSWHSEIEATATGGSADDGGASTSLGVSAWRQEPIGGHGLYWIGGVQADRYDFSTGPVARLQDYAVLLGLEYERNGETAARLAIRPGYYFAQRANSRAWDVPVDLVSGVPLVGSIDGVVGFSSGRFYHHPLPIFGLVWDFAPRWHAQLVYPEPALEYAATRTLTLRLAGELSGGGFWQDTPDGHGTPVEYSSYRVGVGVVQTLAPGCKLRVSAGVEAMREFDAFRAGGRRRGGGAGYAGIDLTLAR